MTVLAAGGDNPQVVPPPGTLHDAVNGNPQEPVLAAGAKAEATRIDATGCWVHLKAEDGREGWCHLSGLIPSIGRHVPWLEIAQREIGVTEENEAGLARIGEYLATVPGTKPDDNWCACFINWCMHNADADPENTSRARDWSDWGTRRTGNGRVPSDARLGDLAVGKLEAPEKGKPGHVAILLAYRPAGDPLGDELLLLGGNQSEHPLDGVKDKKTSVRYTWYPRQTLTPPSGLVSVNFRKKVAPPA